MAVHLSEPLIWNFLLTHKFDYESKVNILRPKFREALQMGVKIRRASSRVPLSFRPLSVVMAGGLTRAIRLCFIFRKNRTWGSC